MSKNQHGEGLSALRMPDFLAKFMLASLLGSPQPMVIGWGPGFVSFFNDRRRHILGARFNGQSGRPAA